MYFEQISSSKAATKLENEKALKHTHTSRLSCRFARRPRSHSIWLLACLFACFCQCVCDVCVYYNIICALVVPFRVRNRTITTTTTSKKRPKHSHSQLYQWIYSYKCERNTHFILCELKTHHTHTYIYISHFAMAYLWLFGNLYRHSNAWGIKATQANIHTCTQMRRERGKSTIKQSSAKYSKAERYQRGKKGKSVCIHTQRKQQQQQKRPKSKNKNHTHRERRRARAEQSRRI